MKIKEQILSREQMARLVELGVDTSDASMAWYMSPNTNQWKIKIKDKFAHEMLRRISPERYIPTYTTGDLIEKLPKHINSWNDNRLVIEGDEYADYWYVVYKNRYEHSETEYFDSENLLTALYNLLCWVAETHKELLVKK